MNKSTIPENTTSSNPVLGVQYLLTELDFQVAIEAKARERVENMAQNLLATIAAVIGAVLLGNQMQVNKVQLWFVASFLLLIFTITWFSRFCRLRYITTYSRVNRNKIRYAISLLDIPEANKLIKWEGNPSGFGKRMMVEGWSLLGLSCLLGGASGGLALMLIYHINKWPFDITSAQWVLLVMVPLILMVVIGIVLRKALMDQKSKSNQ